MTGQRWVFAAVILVACTVVVFQAVHGCRQAMDTPAPWFTGEYVDPACSGGRASLDVREDGTFTLRLSEGRGRGDDMEAREIGRGTWRSLGDGVELDGGEWTAALMTDDIPVTLLDRSDTLSGLRWVVTRGSAPIDSARFLVRGEFADFVRPPGGSGRSGAGL